MSAKRFVIWFSIVGALVPLSWLAFYWTFGQSPEVSKAIMKSPWLESLLLMLWPGSILLIGDPEDKSVMLPVLSTAMNVGLYAILGWLFSIGFTRSKVILAATGIAILVGWYWLLSL
ncbi:MAG: hypothetical protein ACT4P3_00160 [Betaproteobacteria bacterium]